MSTPLHDRTKGSKWVRDRGRYIRFFQTISRESEYLENVDRKIRVRVFSQESYPFESSGQRQRSTFPSDSVRASRENSTLGYTLRRTPPSKPLQTHPSVLPQPESPQMSLHFICSSQPCLISILPATVQDLLTSSLGPVLQPRSPTIHPSQPGLQSKILIPQHDGRGSTRGPCLHLRPHLPLSHPFPTLPSGSSIKLTHSQEKLWTFSKQKKITGGPVQCILWSYLHLSLVLRCFMSLIFRLYFISISCRLFHISFLKCVHSWKWGKWFLAIEVQTVSLEMQIFALWILTSSFVSICKLFSGHLHMNVLWILLWTMCNIFTGFLIN